MRKSRRFPWPHLMKPGWSKPSTILFASEIPANEKALGFALAQAREFGANLILFHAYDTMVVAASETSGIRYYDYAAAARAEIHHLEPLGSEGERSGRPVRSRGAAGTGRRPDSQLPARARDRPHRDGHPFVRAPSANCWWAQWPRLSCAPPECPSSLLAPMWWTATIATMPPRPSSAPSACSRPAM